MYCITVGLHHDRELLFPTKLVCKTKLDCSAAVSNDVLFFLSATCCVTVTHVFKLKDFSFVTLRTRESQPARITEMLESFFDMRCPHMIHGEQTGPVLNKEIIMNMEMSRVKQGTFCSFIEFYNGLSFYFVIY